jgi:hypothetical protein
MISTPRRRPRAVDRQVDGRNVEAHAACALLRARRGLAARDKVAERQLFLIEEPSQRVPKAMELGAPVRDQLDDSGRSRSSSQLEIDPTTWGPCRAVPALYDKTGNHQDCLRQREG